MRIAAIPLAIGGAVWYHSSLITQINELEMRVAGFATALRKCDAAGAMTKADMKIMGKIYSCHLEECIDLMEQIGTQRDAGADIK